MRKRIDCIALMLGVSVLVAAGVSQAGNDKPRARDLGLEVGVFPTGTNNAITDVDGVKVGHRTIIKGKDIRTGVTVILPAEGDLFNRPIPAAIHVGNGYGKLLGVTQVQELGQLESPIALTCTTCVWRVADALKEWMYASWKIGDQTVNPVVGETNDFGLNNQRANPVGRAEVVDALEAASGGLVEEGSVGAGTGTKAFGWKGGIGTSSRKLPESLGGYTVGVLVQTNYGGMLTISGVPVGRELGRYSFRNELENSVESDEDDDGSIMMVVATDAPIDARNLERLAMRAMMGLARTGSYASNGSGDYVIAFSTHPELRLARNASEPRAVPALANGAMSPLFAAAAEATEESIYNAMLKATTITSSRGTLEALPIDKLTQVLRQHDVLPKR